jgi:phenylalanine-4-hydroxylase
MPDEGFTKHGLLAGDAAPPHRADWTIDQDWEKYKAAEHATWRTLFERQVKLLAGRACDEYLAGSSRGVPHGSPLSHHRAYGSRTRRFP